MIFYHVSLKLKLKQQKVEKSFVSYWVRKKVPMLYFAFS